MTSIAVLNQYLFYGARERSKDGRKAVGHFTRRAKCSASSALLSNINIYLFIADGGGGLNIEGKSKNRPEEGVTRKMDRLE